MSKGTPSFGKHGKKHTHVRCPRCGKFALHRRRDICASCGYGRSKCLK
ncbi:MAG: 50S ribosomal protein L37e [Candidatus Altiarchaeota archaeon]|nr:50S ribosomal protein L37e [Candidatus Altiarchaeota archaeon]MBU4266958.1 50S ribosomal protein L37e [Candidatus Altiarchaeota archaeon]MBU4341604.1 50S ribosomal protein L37e [Candidatus Altiarchaeota archaeon]MBU4436912.1 50S ribosomal protein L37e [Candidatus Altiarchaeota archaeon]